MGSEESGRSGVEKEELEDAMFDLMAGRNEGDCEGWTPESYMNKTGGDSLGNEQFLDEKRRERGQDGKKCWKETILEQTDAWDWSHSTASVSIIEFNP